MARFHFRLHAVEELRKSKEDESLRALAAAQRAYVAQVERKRELQAQLAAAVEQRASLGSEPTGIDAFHVVERHILGTKQRIGQTDQAILRARRAADRAMAAFLQARQKRKMIEKLRERAYEEFKTAERKRETKRLDDLYVMRARFRSEVSSA